MSNSVTSGVEDGNESLRDYLMRVGRLMGFAVGQREEGMDEPVRPLVVASRYEESVRRAQATLDRLRAMSEVDVNVASYVEHGKRYEEWKGIVAKKNALRRRYEVMLARVEEWECDPLVKKAKDVAIRELRDAIAYEDSSYAYPEPRPKTGAAWLAERIDDAEAWLRTSRESLRKEVERVEERNRYVRAFLDSLPVEERVS